MVSKGMAQALTWNEYERDGIRYCFVITHEADYAGDRVRQKARDAPYEYGPRIATEEEYALALKGKPFRLLDGDGEFCAKGRMWTSDAENWWESEAAFAPLDDYGEGAWGATTLQYRESGEWVTV